MTNADLLSTGTPMEARPVPAVGAVPAQRTEEQGTIAGPVRTQLHLDPITRRLPSR